MEDHVKYVNANYHQLKDDGTTLGIQLITCRPKHHKELTYPQYNCVGRFQELRLLSHQCISHYLEILPSKHNETYILSEAYKDTIYSQALHIEEKQISRLLQDVIEGIEYIHNHGMVVGIIDPKYIYITKKQNAKIGNYALYHLSKENFFIHKFLSCTNYCSRSC
ncbi:Protein kinase domain-containing protein [Entamoeba marina]